ncbi:MAG: hydantoinase B/oxoprolinase family protein, partial [Alphaproteobacteria bacterium]
MDMVTMNIIESTLVSICREMGLTMMKTAYSTIFNEGMDFTCGLGNTNGEMIGVAEFNPSQIGGMPLVLKTTAEEIPHDSIQEGDVIVTNDPYRGGMHTPEHTFIKPVFVDDVLYGYAVAIGHVAEVGGMVPGGFAGEATEIFHEGFRVPPVKIKKAGRDVDAVWKLLLANVRTPRNNHGDYRAMISAVDVGAARLKAVIEKYGADVFRQTVTDLMDYSETRMRSEIGDIRDGKYSFEDYMEDDGIEAKPYRIHVDVHVQGEEVVVDYSASDAQAKGPINAVLSVAWSSAYNAILHLTDPSIPKNSGCFRPIKVVAPGGSIVNADYPATCVGGNTETHIRIAYTIIGAMAQCVPERAFATDAGTHSNFLFGANDPRRDEYVVCYDFTCAAWGGRPFADGNEAVNCINGNSRMVSIEVFEVRYPWLIEEFKLEPDSAGPGRYWGGHAVSKTFRAVD